MKKFVSIMLKSKGFIFLVACSFFVYFAGTMDAFATTWQELATPTTEGISIHSNTNDDDPNEYFYVSDSNQVVFLASQGVNVQGGGNTHTDILSSDDIILDIDTDGGNTGALYVQDGAINLGC